MIDENLQTLSPKERVLKAINFEEPDRIPIFITITPQVAEAHEPHTGQVRSS